jgi:hypothetical protein
MTKDTGQHVGDQIAKTGVDLLIPTDVFKVRFPMAAYMRWDGEQRGAVTYRVVGLAPPAPPSPNVCESQRLLDLMGYGRCGADGSANLHVREFVCWDEWKIGSEDQVWVLVTPRSTEPVSMTHVVHVPPVLVGPPPSPAELDLQIRVFAWDPDGQPKADVSFTWRAVIVVSIGSTGV